MIIVNKCPYCGKKLVFESYSKNRKIAKREKRELKICINLFDSCDMIHN